MTAFDPLRSLEVANVNGRRHPISMGNPGVIGVVIFTALAAGCASSGADDLARVAQQPASFVGQTVRVCGYVRNAHEDHGIWRSKRAHSSLDMPILGLIPTKDTPHAVSACIKGEIVRTGCGEELICLDANVPFALREGT